MAMIFFVCWTIWAVQANGPIGFLMHLFAPKGDTTGFLKVLMVVVFMAVGCLEVVSILFRPVSLSFRLFGNIFAGENMLETMAKLVPGWLGSIVIPIPFYFMEIAGGIGAGTGVHAADRRVHHADLPARRGQHTAKHLKHNDKISVV